MKTLIIGSSGKISKVFKDKYYDKKKFVFTTSNKKLANKGTIFFDINKSDITQLVKKNNIDKVVIFTAISNPEKCKSQKKISYNINVKFTKKLIQNLISLNIYFVFFSSEYVFDGFKGNYSENSKTYTKMIYGKHKIEIENFIKSKKNNNSLILRISKTFGTDIHDGTFFTRYLKAYICGQRIFEIAKDQIFSPLYVNDLVRIINLSLKFNLTGLYNVCGNSTNTRINFIKNFFNQLKIKDVKLVKVALKKFDNKIFYPLNISMKNDKIKKKLNFKFTKINNLKFKFHNSDVLKT